MKSDITNDFLLYLLLNCLAVSSITATPAIFIVKACVHEKKKISGYYKFQYA